MKTNPAKPIGSPAFAIIITLLLMTLIALLAVGMLSLSAATLRGSSVREARDAARANARTALILAIGKLQETMGPDQRISAQASLIDPTANPGITGVWESWSPNPEGGNDYAKRRTAQRSSPEPDGEFVGWLVSDPAGVLPPKPDSPPKGDSGTLLLSGVNGGQGVMLEPTLLSEKGGIAWVVTDEGVKARFDFAEEPATVAGAQYSRLRAPARNSPESIPGLEALNPDTNQAAALVSTRQAEIIAGRDLVKNFHHDITPYSASVLANVASGGLKGDLSRAFEQAELPTELEGIRVYSQSDTPVAAADPFMRSLADHYRLYKRGSDPNAAIDAEVPVGYAAYSGSAPDIEPNLAPPEGTLLLPVISKVQIVFSMFSRVGHGHWKQTIPNRTGDPNRRYMVYLIYTPVITVQNPYDVPLNVSDLRVTFRNLPVAFRFFRNGTAQTQNHALLSQFHVVSQNNPGNEDRFSVNVSDYPGALQGDVVLRPGEARVFGISHPAGSGWGDMTNFVWRHNQVSKTLAIGSASGWDFRSGFIVDWLSPNGAVKTADTSGLGVFGVRGDDKIDVAFSPKMPTNSNGEFSLEIEARVPGSETDERSRVAFYRYRYGTEERLREILENGQNSQLGKVEYPIRREKPWDVNELFQPSIESTPLEEWTGTKQFAIFTLSDRTAQDSRYPGKPVRDFSFVHNVLDMDVRTASPAQFPMEISLLPITGTGANTAGSIDADASDRAYFFSGDRALTGSVSSPSYQIPAAPMTNIADLRHANLASGGYFPIPTYTVGESVAPSMLPAQKTKVASSLGNFEALDHAWLANSKLWDGFYFSTISDSDEADRLLGGRRLAHNPRHVACFAPGATPASAKSAILSEDGWKSSAANQLRLGAFNVNSTSQEAWTAVLSSHTGAEIPVLNPVTLELTEKTADPLPILRLLRSSDGSIDENPDNARRWGGYRDLDDGKVTALAAEIVNQVREKGPFLSMSDFLNRRLVAESDPDSAGGPLKIAIRKSGINDLPVVGITREVTSLEAEEFGFANPTAAAGDAEEGSRLNITQGDLLSMIGANLTVRSDTFVIRAYGDARDPSSGEILARAWCEAVIQRVPSFVDPTDDANKVIGVLGGSGNATETLSETNRRFGRKFSVVSFRWLSGEEI